MQTGKACLGDIIYRYITAEQFSPECLLDCLDLSSEHHTLEVANRIEASVHLWRLKDRKKYHTHQKPKRKTWGGKVKDLVADGERNLSLAQRAETLLHSLKLRFPGLPQTALDMSKIQYNRVIHWFTYFTYCYEHKSLICVGQSFLLVALVDIYIYSALALRYLYCISYINKWK